MYVTENYKSVTQLYFSKDLKQIVAVGLLTLQIRIREVSGSNLVVFLSPSR
jgi:hypothetical protein